MLLQGLRKVNSCHSGSKRCDLVFRSIQDIEDHSISTGKPGVKAPRSITDASTRLAWPHSPISMSLEPKLEDEEDFSKYRRVRFRNQALHSSRAIRLEVVVRQGDDWYGVGKGNADMQFDRGNTAATLSVIHTNILN